MRITVLKANPPPASSFASLFLGLIGIVLVAVGATAEGEVSDRLGYFVAAAAVLGFAFMAGRAHTANRVRHIKHEEEWAVAAEAEARRIGQLDQLQPLEVPISLHKNEECYWQGEATWYEYRSTIRRINYHGPVISIPIAKGIRYRAGSIAPSIERSSELVPIDHGTMYVTSRSASSSMVRVRTHRSPGNGLTAVQVFRGGLILEKNTGKSPHIMVREGAETAAALIARQLA